MATLAIGAIGAGIGASMGAGTILGMSYAAFGWNVGSLVGGMLFAPKMPHQYGPRLGDLKVQASTYGNPIPQTFGATRVAGNVIWAADIVETEHTTSAGGKGGGGPSQTNYTYTQTFALALCEGEIAGVRKIWANGELIYNLSDTADIATIIASNQVATAFHVYTGSETQDPDATIEAYEGAGNVPAYRGLAYIIMVNTSRILKNTNFEFEVVKTGTGAIAWVDAGYTRSGTTDGIVNRHGHMWRGGTYPLMHKYDAVTGALITTASVGSIGTTNFHSVYNFPDGGCGIYTNYPPSGYTYRFVLMDSDGVVQEVIPDGAIFSYFWFSGAIKCANDSVWLHHTNPYSPNQAYLIRSDGGVTTPAISGGFTLSKLSGIQQGRIYFMPSGNTTLKYFDDAGVVHDFFSYSTISFYAPRYDGKVWIGTSAVTVLLVSAEGVVEETVTISPPDNGVGISLAATPYCNVLKSSNDLIAMCAGSTYSSLFRITGSTMEVAYAAKLHWSVVHYSRAGYADSGLTVSDESNIQVLADLPVVTGTAVALSAVVTAICSQCGLSGGDIDVTDLTADTVDGYVVQRGTARSWLEQLMQAFYFDAVESDGKVKFVKRGNAAAVTITEDDLAAHEYGSSPPDTLLINRRQEMELPVEVAVQYLDKDAAYAVGSQYAQRLTTDSDNKTSINLAIAMSATKAKQIADVMMYDLWTARTNFEFQTGWKYCYLEPTDVINVVKDGRTYTARLTDEDFAITTRRSAVLEDADIYSQSGVAASVPAPAETVASVPLTKLVLLDLPLLRDTDDGVGFYAAACGYADGWLGAQLYKSNDSGATWTSFGDAFLHGATIGTASTVLGTFTGGNVFDETNSVTVTLLNGTLASDTFANVLNGANAALLGDEIIQFREATLTADNTYVLTGLLRGRQGTEWAMGTHAIGDRFVLLDSSTTYIFTGPSSEYDLTRHYRAASFGGYLDDATTQAFANTAVALIPYAPVLLGGGRNAAGDLTLNWTRRTRISGGWNNYSDVPLGEASEAYKVRIYSDSGYATVLRTITGISAQTTSYSAADQTTDFGSPQSTVYWDALQVSATVGDGYAARGAT